jgi:hypothetical protein
MAKRSAPKKPPRRAANKNSGDFDAIRGYLAEVEPQEQRKRKLVDASRTNLEKLRNYLAPRLRNGGSVREYFGLKFEIRFDVTQANGALIVGFGFVADDEEETSGYRLFLEGEERFSDFDGDVPSQRIFWSPAFKSLAADIFSLLSNEWLSAAT